MILAAGFGKRMMPLTATTPKPLLRVGGKPLIQYHIEALRDVGITELVINHAYLGEQIEACLGDGSQFAVNISYSAESEPLNTAGGISKALKLLGDEPFILVNGDIWVDYDFANLKNITLVKQMAHLILVGNPDHNTSGDFALAGDGSVQASGSELLTYSGIAVLSKKIFDHYNINSGPLGLLLRQAIAEQQVSGEYFSGFWCDVGTPERLTGVDQLVTSMQG